MLGRCSERVLRANPSFDSHDPCTVLESCCSLRREVTLELAAKDHLVPLVHGVDCIPSYFIVGERDSLLPYLLYLCCLPSSPLYALLHLLHVAS
jgi:hypothetical protein